MTRGFVTIATGDERYYKMALNLLISYRYFSKKPMPFAVIADAENKYTEQFDKVVLLKNVHRSYMDKIELVQNAPFDETIFIDADCLAYKDLNCYWEYFKNADDFSAFGEAYDLNSTSKGWFKQEDVGEFKDKINFITHLHGGVYFIRKSDILGKLLRLCYYIIENYSKFKFRMFDSPADEPVFALAMAVLNLKPVSPVPGLMCFYPCITYFMANIEKGELHYSVPWFNGRIEENGCCVHWGNFNVDKPVYKTEAYKLMKIVDHRKINKYMLFLNKICWRVQGYIKVSWAKVWRHIGRYVKNA